MRVHELAKLLDISSKDCMARLRDLGIETKSHMSTVDDALAETLVDGEPSSDAKTPEPAPVEKPPKPAAKPVAETPPAEEAPPKQPDQPAEASAREPATAAADEKVFRVKGPLVVKELAERLNIRPNQMVAELMRMNVLASITQKVEVAVIKTIAESHGFTFEHEKRTADYQVSPAKLQLEKDEEEDRPEDLIPRSPVVTFLGHVDHGKTSLLDHIRRAAVVDGEFGGITQHIGAYTVETNGQRITFLDTPGHAAFTSMRARGANLTDIAVIIIAADDGIMPQTKEAIQHARAAGVALIVAINKIDLPAADVDRVKQQLQADDLSPEDWGGETICCPVSAHTGEGIDHLLEMILLQADVLELRANPARRARGYVIEARLEPGMGPTANVLVTNGTLKVGDFMLCGSHCGKVRALISDHGVKIKSANPSTPVRCLGLSGVPEAGAEFRILANEKVGRSMAEDAMTNLKQEQLQSPRKVSLDNLFDQIEGDKKLELRVVLKADTQGSIEAIAHSLDEIKSDKIALNILLSATGNVTDNDVMLASASNAIILGFHVGKEPGVDSACRREGVEVRLHQIIYELIDEVREGMTGLLSPELRENVVGTAEIREVFPIGKLHRVAGCMVTGGKISPRNRVRVRRGEDVLFEGSIASLKHFQDSVAEVREAQECGIRIEKFNAISEGDILEFYDVEEVQQTL